jgi:TonB-linked SusC/RagA family outer membrane protein
MKKKSNISFIVKEIMQCTVMVFILLFSTNSYSRGHFDQKLLDKRLSINFKDEEFKKVLFTIENFTEAKFVYSPELIKASRKVTISAKDEKLSNILSTLLSPLGITYELLDNYIVLKKDAELLAVLESPIRGTEGEKSPPQTVSGKVISAAGLPLEGVSVVQKNTDNATTTNAKGEFSISVSSGASVLVFSYVGFTTQEVTVGNNSTLEIKLSPSSGQLDEVVVIGYGTVKKSDITGAVSSVSSDKITQVKAISNVAQTLQGQAAGVQVIQRSGQPGEGVSIKVRGTNSIAGGNDVLYVVDGLPLDGLSAQLNPSDIETIEVLKDASSTAIYGSRGANGVIMITTKKGKDGKLSVSYNGYYGSQSLRKKLDLVNAREFAILQNEAIENWNSDNPTSPQKPIVWSQTQLDSLNGKGTDWQDLVYRNAAVQNHDVSVSGGTGGTRFYTSFGYFAQNGIIRNSSFDRYSFRLNLDQKIFERLTSNLSLSLQQSNFSQNNYFNADGGGGVPFTTMVMPPTQGIYDAAGKYTIFTGVPWGQTNPYAIANEEYRYNPSLRLIGNVQLAYTIANGLKLKLNAGIDNSWSKGDYYAPRNLSLYVNGGASQNYSTSSTFVNENLLTYNKAFGKHSLDVVAGITYQTSKGSSLNSGTASGFLTDIYQDNNLGAASVKAQPGTNYSDSRLLSYLGRINYAYDGRYLLTLTARYDGSSRFSESHKYGFFPSGAVGWRISEEKFMQQVKPISNLKLRASYGLSGNQAIGSYQTLGQLNNTNVTFNNQPVTGYYLSRLENKNLKWETTRQLDLGIDLGLFKNRIQFTADYYSKKTVDLLLNVTLPTSSGFSSVLQNVGSVGNKGFEFQLTTQNLTGQLSWTTVLTFSHNKTKILDLGKDALGNPITYKEVGTGGNWFPMILGQSMQQLFGYKVLGIYQSDAEAVANGEPTKKAGDYKFQTSQGGILPNDNRLLLSHFEPKFTFGFNNNISYKNFSLSVLLVGSYGNDIANEFRKYNITLNGKWTPTKEAFDNRWQPGKTTAKFDRPQFENSGSTIRDYANSLWIENGSYLRFRDITLAYDIPATGLKAIKISSAQVYVSVQNYITITKYSGYDPEASWQAATINGWDRGNYPGTKGITAGLKVNF